MPPGDATEVSPEGWNDELPDTYAFLYADTTGAHVLLCSNMGQRRASAALSVS